MKIKLGDILIVVLVLFLAFAILTDKKEQGDTVVLFNDGKIIKTFALDSDEQYTFNSEFENVIQIKNGAVSVIHSDCPDKTCVHSGKISKQGQVICCLPNKMIIKIESKQSEVDVISG